MFALCVCFSFTDWTTGADASVSAKRVFFFSALLSLADLEESSGISGVLL